MLLTRKEDQERLDFFTKSIDKFSLSNFSKLFDYSKEGFTMNTSTRDEAVTLNVETDNSSVPLIVAFRKDIHELVSSADVADYVRQLKKDKICRFTFASSLSELPKALMEKPQCLLFYANGLFEKHDSIAEFVMMIKTMIHFTEPENKVKIGFVLCKETPHSFIKELQKAGVHGIVPTVEAWGKAETSKGLEAIINGIAYWPKHLIEQLPGQVTKTKKETVHLTPRQREVLDLIANRGLSNKQIARVLGISESTVKIHVSAIMKAYCVRNRTQLALMKK
jgi:DNA-binding CsgD family transcriptional regulator